MLLNFFYTVYQALCFVLLLKRASASGSGEMVFSTAVIGYIGIFPYFVLLCETLSFFLL